MSNKTAASSLIAMILLLSSITSGLAADYTTSGPNVYTYPNYPDVTRLQWTIDRPKYQEAASATTSFAVPPNYDGMKICGGQLFQANGTRSNQFSFAKLTDNAASVAWSVPCPGGSVGCWGLGTNAWMLLRVDIFLVPDNQACSAHADFHDWMKRENGGGVDLWYENK